jgi:hypothetical protein
MRPRKETHKSPPAIFRADTQIDKHDPDHLSRVAEWTSKPTPRAAQQGTRSPQTSPRMGTMSLLVPAVAAPAVACCGRACLCLLCFEVRSPGANVPHAMPGVAKAVFWSGGFCDCIREGPRNRQTVLVPGHFPNQVCLLKSLADPPYITAQSVSNPATRIPASPAGGRAKPNRPVVHLHPHPGVRNPQPGRFIVKRPLSVIGPAKSVVNPQPRRFIVDRPGPRSSWTDPGPGVRNPQPGRFIVKRPLSAVRRAQGIRNPQPRRFIVDRPGPRSSWTDPGPGGSEPPAQRVHRGPIRVLSYDGGSVLGTPSPGGSS